MNQICSNLQENIKWMNGVTETREVRLVKRFNYDELINENYEYLGNFFYLVQIY